MVRPSAPRFLNFGDSALEFTLRGWISDFNDGYQVRSELGVSVVIPTFNRATLLREAMASVWAQQCRDFEVIVVDDGSSDGSNELIETIRLQDPRLGVR